MITKFLAQLFALSLALVLITAACGSASSVEDSQTTAESDEAATDQVDTEAEATTEDAASDGAEAESESESEAAAGESEQVEINLIDELDGILNGYCLDIAGGNEDVDPANGLQAHTCYSYDGALGTDQIFDTAEFTNNALYMPIYDVCAEVASLSAGETIGLNTCDGSDLQTANFDTDGTIRPSANTSLCFTAGAESRTGRSGDHQIRDLSLEACSNDLTSLQQWTSRTGI